MTPPRGRGAPVVFDEALREKYLAAITQGMHLKDAAAHIGLHRDHLSRLARQDQALGTAVKQARELGKKARLEELPHDESRYNHQGCRCRKCCAAATAARTGRRHTAQDDPGGQVYDLPPAQVPSSFSLLEAS